MLPIDLSRLVIERSILNLFLVYCVQFSRKSYMFFNPTSRTFPTHVDSHIEKKRQTPWVTSPLYKITKPDHYH
jgi:hypothetical protein